MFQYVNQVNCSAVNGANGHNMQASQKDTTLTKIFVGGLPYHTTDKSLKKFFESFGDIEEAVVITDRQTGKSRGYGFVSTLFLSLSFLSINIIIIFAPLFSHVNICI